jgi:hypothetical protein
MKLMSGIGSYFQTNLKVVVETFDGVRNMAATSLRVTIKSMSFSSGAHPSGGIRVITLNMIVWLGAGPRKFALPTQLSSVINSTHAEPNHTNLPNHHSCCFVG